MRFIEYLSEFNVVSVLVRLILAMLLGGIIGIERGKHGRAAGMRTHILVCLGSALTALIGIYITYELGFSSDPLRISAQVISGIGFLGVGTILTKGRFQVTGLTTAAGLWATASIGIALGVGFYEGAFIVALISFLTVTVFHRIESKVSKKHTHFGIYVEINSDKNIRHTIDFLEERYSATAIQVTFPRSGTVGNVGIEATINDPENKLTSSEMAKEIEALEETVFAIESI